MSILNNRMRRVIFNNKYLKDTLYVVQRKGKYNEDGNWVWLRNDNDEPNTDDIWDTTDDHINYYIHHKVRCIMNPIIEQSNQDESGSRVEGQRIFFIYPLDEDGEPLDINTTSDFIWYNDNDNDNDGWHRYLCRQIETWHGQPYIEILCEREEPQD